MDVQRVEILHDKGFCCRCQLMEFLHVHWILPKGRPGVQQLKTTVLPPQSETTSSQALNGNQEAAIFPTKTEDFVTESKYYQQSNDDNHSDNVNPFDLLAARAGICLVESDMRRDAIGKASGSQASSATNWIHDASAFALQRVMNRVLLQVKLTKSFEKKRAGTQSQICPYLTHLYSILPCVMCMDGMQDAGTTNWVRS